jgi:hypothetical protein
MKAQFEIHLDDDLKLWAFDSGLKSLMIAQGGGSFRKSQGRKSDDTKYDYA